jgi:flavin reductase (DIM6/NTAB) family NADH-FMN oxidoreductase RutF
LFALRQPDPERGRASLHLRSELAAWRVAQLFASGQPDRFCRVRWQAEPGTGGLHLLNDAYAIVNRRVSRTEAVGDHVVVFGEVDRIW